MSAAPPLPSLHADDPDLAEIVELFVRALPERVASVREACASGELEQVRRVAHQLKGAGGGYGYPSITEVCRRIEQLAAAGDAAGLAAPVGELEELVRRAEAGLDVSGATDGVP